MLIHLAEFDMQVGRDHGHDITIIIFQNDRLGDHPRRDVGRRGGIHGGCRIAVGYDVVGNTLLREVFFKCY